MIHLNANKKKAEVTTIDVAIPDHIENIKLPDPVLVTYYQNIDNRILWIDDEICDYSLEYGKQIMLWNKEDLGIPCKDRKPIRLLFFSPGGELDVNQMLIDTIALSKTPIIGVNCGLCASAAAFIYLATDTRYTFPSARFLIHQGAGSFEGTYNMVVEATINYQKQIEELGEYILERTNIPEDLFEERFATDWYITAEEAVEYGICSKIITSLDEILL